MIDVGILDSQTGQRLKINGEGEISVTVHTHPPIEEKVSSYPFSDWFQNSGSNDLRVDGSTTPQYFSIAASVDKNVFIKVISVRISDAGASLSEFANKTALTNGISFIYRNNDIGEVVIQDEIKTNLDFLRLGVSSPSIGGTDAFKADLSGGGADTYLPVIDLTQTFGFPWGLHLPKGTNASIGFFVNDDLSVGIDTFDIKGFGVQI